MYLSDINNRDFSKEFVFYASRSSGPGGQNVNKINSKVELRLNISDSSLFTEDEKLIIGHKLKKYINQKSDFIITSQTERTQLLNKKKCIEKFYFIISNALIPRKRRIKTVPTKASLEKRFEMKKTKSIAKKLRQKPEIS